MYRLACVCASAAANHTNAGVSRARGQNHASHDYIAWSYVCIHAHASKRASTPFQALCNGDYLRPLRLEIWDWDRDGGHDCMGKLTTNLQALLEGQGREMDLEV